jgi:Response regulator containing a CheY-like receiver domain and a GGDEF domain
MPKNANILIVDDNQENLKVASAFLREKGYKIALALDGSSALQIVTSNKIDLILLDIMMPGMDGFEVCRRLKENKETAAIPIIFLTAKNDPEDIVKGFEHGGVDYVTKPLKKEELFARVECHAKLKLCRDLLRTYSGDDKASDNVAISILEEIFTIMDIQN